MQRNPAKDWAMPSLKPHEIWWTLIESGLHVWHCAKLRALRQPMFNAMLSLLLSLT